MNYLEIISLSLIAAASGFVGTFALMRRMILAADSISHIALPGLGLALLLEINPLLGGAAALFLGVILIWFLENKTALNTEVVIGVIFAVSLALGSLLTPGEELLEALFGSSRAAGFWELLAGSLAALFIIMVIFLLKEKLVLSLVSSDLAQVTGVKVKRLSLYFLLVFALNIVLGLQFLGVLLMGSLMIVPAAIGRNLGESINSALVISALTAIISIVVGFWVNSAYGLNFGPMVIVAATAIFLLSLLKK